MLAIGTFATTGYIGRYLRSEFLPLEDQSEFDVKVKTPLGASAATTDRILEQVRRRFEGQPWLDYTFVTIGADELQRVNEGTMYVRMMDMAERSISQQDRNVKNARQ